MKEHQDEYIERKICTGFITSTEYLQQVRDAWDPRWMESDTARLLTSWCVEYFDTYNRAPGKDIEGIYTEKLKAGIDKDKGEWIEEILRSLSEQYEQAGGNDYQEDQTKKYFTERYLKLLIEDTEYELDKGNTDLAMEMLAGYSPLIVEDSSTIDPFSSGIRERVELAFAERKTPLIRFPKALGRFWNAELVRGGFVAIMGKEKSGKSFLLIELAMRAIKSRCKIAFFQAGDMTELQQLRRMAIYLAGRSDQERYCGAMWKPIPDCLHHQMDTCDRGAREDSSGLILAKKESITYEVLITAAQEYPEHVPCHNCPYMKGSPWLVLQPGVQPLTWKEAYKYLRRFGHKYPGAFRLSSHPNETLSISSIKSYLTMWKKREDFVPDVIIIDYADILAPDPDISRLEFRHQQNRIWQRLRTLSEERNCLVITATQAAARSYDKELMSMSDFSEDKRKMSHCTSLFGINQNSNEKQIGIMRINPIVIRESDFNTNKPVYILQKLQMGRPVLGSYF